MSDPAPLVIEGVTKRWGTSVVLDGVDLVVEPGRVAWIGGDNGVGKTTLARIASGLLVPDAGHVRLFGLDPDRDRFEYHRRLGVLAAGDRGLYARLTTRQNLDFAGGMALLPAPERRRAVAMSIERFGLGDLAGRRVDRMSMGQRQRVRLAMTFLHEPSVVLLDEPRTSLDESGLALLTAALAEVTDGGGAVLWCSPTIDPPDVGHDAHRLADGKVLPC